MIDMPKIWTKDLDKCALPGLDKSCRCNGKAVGNVVLTGKIVDRYPGDSRLVNMRLGMVLPACDHHFNLYMDDLKLDRLIRSIKLDSVGYLAEALGRAFEKENDRLEREIKWRRKEK